MDKRNDVKEQYNGQKKRRKRTIQVFYVVSFVHCIVLLRRFFCPLYCSFTSFLLSIVLFFYVVSFVHCIVLLRRFFCPLYCSFTSFLLSIVLFFYVISFVHCSVRNFTLWLLVTPLVFSTFS
jgi:uncharacterized membrane protein